MLGHSRPPLKSYPGEDALALPPLQLGPEDREELLLRETHEANPRGGLHHLRGVVPLRPTPIWPSTVTMTSWSAMSVTSIRCIPGRTIGRFVRVWEQIGVSTIASIVGNRIGPPAERL